MFNLNVLVVDYQTNQILVTLIFVIYWRVNGGDDSSTYQMWTSVSINPLNQSLMITFYKIYLCTDFSEDNSCGFL